MTNGLRIHHKMAKPALGQYPPPEARSAPCENIATTWMQDEGEISFKRMARRAGESLTDFRLTTGLPENMRMCLMARFSLSHVTAGCPTSIDPGKSNTLLGRYQRFVFNRPVQAHLLRLVQAQTSFAHQNVPPEGFVFHPRCRTGTWITKKAKK